jgi:ADP-heptose:LPS heptosyltransferase
LASTSCNELAGQLLASCLNGERWPDALLDKLTTPDCSDALFRVVVERLADLFDPRHCDTYADLFSAVIARAIPDLKAADLRARYDRVRWPCKFQGDAKSVETVFVLSRVTLGADVAVTSVLLDAAKRRFPEARIVIVGSKKSYELFAGDSRIAHAPVTYRRAGSLHDRLAPWQEVTRALAARNSIVIDPDSRLTQLGLLPVCPEEIYYFFESRAYGAGGGEPLPALAARWALETFGIKDAAPWIAPAPSESIKIPRRPFVTMSLGVGENPAKRIGEDFEEQLVGHVARTGANILIDEGAGGEEAGRVTRAISKCGAPAERVRSFRGSFAAFAVAIRKSDLYIGYDSAGQHVAAACGVPLLSIFAGFPSDRFLARWRPWGKGAIEIVTVRNEAPAAVLFPVVEALARLKNWKR